MLLLEIGVSVCEEEKEFAFVRYIDANPPRDNEDRALGCNSLR